MELRQWAKLSYKVLLIIVVNLVLIAVDLQTTNGHTLLLSTPLVKVEVITSSLIWSREAERKWFHFVQGSIQL